MFVGLTRELKRTLQVPVLCAVQGEEIFLDRLVEPYRTQARDALRQRAGDVDAFLSPSGVYADAMSEYLEVPRDRFHVVPLGLRLQGHGDGPTPARDEGPFRIGYLARICPDKGLHVAADALRLLAARLGPGSVRLEAAGWLGAADRAYFHRVRDGLEADGLDFVYHGAVDRTAKVDFLRRLHVLTVPAPYHEPKGLYVLEALANGVPVVQPRHGAFPELIEATGGGLLVEAAEAEAVAGGLHDLYDDDARRRQLGIQGQRAVRENYSDTVMATRTREVYDHYAGRKEPP
jgi:glycosyltransferase involved in cell wall biosynthesis